MLIMSRYSQDTNASPLALEPPQPPQLLNIFHPPTLHSSGSFAQDGSSFYQHPSPNIFTNLDVRARIAANTTTSAGMAHTHLRNAPLPHPGPHISTREQYSAATPTFKRPSEHLSRSPSYSGGVSRRNPLSPTTNQLANFPPPSTRIEPTPQYTNRATANTIPPLLPLQSFGTLNYIDANMTPLKVEIAGTIDKGFFIASDGEWTCYRRNYFTCVCSYSMMPHYPNIAVQFTPQNSNQPLQVYSFAMTISAVVAENDQHGIELVQHTPKRDKGPTGKPEKIPLGPKQGSSSHHHPMSMFGDGAAVSGSRIFADSFASGHQGSGSAMATEHTFERIQFKQATQNNGKRRAAQQFYHLVIELWADTGEQTEDRYVKVACRKSAKMIVRGRSPGHYQNDRRGSQSSGPGGSAGTLGSYGGMNAINDFAPGAILSAAPPYGGGFDGRGPVYGGGRHHDIPAEVMIPPEDEKAIESTKAYRYYPGSIYPDQSEHVDMFQPRHESESHLPHIGSEIDVKPKINEVYDVGGAPRQARPPPLMSGQRRCGPFEGKPDSTGYYPAVMTSSGPNATIT